MNRITPYLACGDTSDVGTDTLPHKRQPLREERRTRREVEAMLREIAFVLHVTRKVRAEIINEKLGSAAVGV